MVMSLLERPREYGIKATMRENRYLLDTTAVLSGQVFVTLTCLMTVHGSSLHPQPR